MPKKRKGKAEGTVYGNPGRRRDEDAKKRILDAALEMLEEIGFANTSVDGIAERAGTGKATIYRWWPNKAAVTVEALEKAVAQEFPVPDNDSDDLYEDIRLQLRTFVRLLSGRRGRIFKAFIIAAQNDPEMAGAFQKLWRKPFRRISKMSLERHRRKGLRETADLDVVLDLMYGPLYYRLLAGGNGIGAIYIDALAEIIVKGISKKI